MNAINNNIPTTIAWIDETDHRIHIRCGYGSALSDFLRGKQVKSKWHADTKTWSVDRTNEKIIPRLEAHAAGQAASEADVKDVHHFTISFKFSSTREAAKKRGCRWNADTKTWYTNSETVLNEMLEMGGTAKAEI